MPSLPLLVRLAIALTATAASVAVLLLLWYPLRWKLFGFRGHRMLSIPAANVVPPVTLLPISPAWYPYAVFASFLDATFLTVAVALQFLSIVSDVSFALRAAVPCFLLAGPVILTRRLAWPWYQHFSLADDAVVIRNGLFATKRLRIPFASITSVLLLQDLPERCCGLATIFLMYTSVPSRPSPPSTTILIGQSLPVATKVAAYLKAAVLRSQTTGISSLPFHG
jgi:uncharacterized membrane protein YdbT with pleckstrin-like domain